MGINELNDVNKELINRLFSNETITTNQTELIPPNHQKFTNTGEYYDFYKKHIVNEIDLDVRFIKYYTSEGKDKKPKDHKLESSVEKVIQKIEKKQLEDQQKQERQQEKQKKYDRIYNRDQAEYFIRHAKEYKILIDEYNQQKEIIEKDPIKNELYLEKIKKAKERIRMDKSRWTWKILKDIQDLNIPDLT